MNSRIILILLIFNVSFSFGQTSLDEIDLEKGKFTVGFRHYVTADSTRTYQRIYDWNNNTIPRPIPVSIWYPSTDHPKQSEARTVLDYMQVLKEEEEWEYLPDEQILNWFYYPNTVENQRHLQEVTRAFAGIKPAKGNFSVLVYAPSYQASSIENFALCEYLASHGYIVISSPSRGTENKFLEGGTGKDLETQARDIEFLIAEVAKIPQANLNQLATMGFSFGGLSNVLAQMRNEQIKAIVSLDGSIKYQYETLKQSPFFNLEKVDVPFIHFAQKDIPKEVIIADKIDPSLDHNFEFYDSLSNSQAYSLKFHNLSHSYFSTLGVLFQPRDERQDKSDLEIMESYKLASVYTLKFLDAFLKDDQEALKFITNQPSDNGIKEDLISYRSKQADIQVFSFLDFNELASSQNYQNLISLYESTLKEHPDLKLPEGNLNNLGLQLLYKPETAQNGINIFLLATHLYPESANLFDSLGEAYLFVGDNEKAMENFEKSLELYPENQNAIERLKQLRN
ncbi:prolyl oligopeptidase family serine peptidase [Algoriphagus yeomjeoni]|uniref:Prolyl oligopeptidase family protein n=1 Tax=Algoriphagus yeomjeoni TaxID=291403 RepID=A0A327P414_9BACT|nr:prolyl oligopeptidase family serine peptidase [Algoriphagus yeomjeoni]RAI85632.1 prolyl oligopeptidase family protein [Algoriphagus yeomjeoni]